MIEWKIFDLNIDLAKNIEDELKTITNNCFYFDWKISNNKIVIAYEPNDLEREENLQ